MFNYHRFVIAPTVVLTAITFAVAYLLHHLTGTPPTWLALPSVGIVAYVALASLYREIKDEYLPPAIPDYGSIVFAFPFLAAILWNTLVLIRMYVFVIRAG